MSRFRAGWPTRTCLGSRGAAGLTANRGTRQFPRGIDRNGLAQGAIHDLRLGQDGAPRAAFILNRPERAGTRFLVVGQGFGCGSSREHAVWGLMQPASGP